MAKKENWKYATTDIGFVDDEGELCTAGLNFASEFLALHEAERRNEENEKQRISNPKIPETVWIAVATYSEHKLIKPDDRYRSWKKTRSESLQRARATGRTRQSSAGKSLRLKITRKKKAT